MDWQPIETAPKDGTVILIAGGHSDYFVHAHRKEEIELGKAPAVAIWASDDWLVSFAEACCVAVCRIDPTHWMPLPPPPGKENE